jgi:hypothetical protein
MVSLIIKCEAVEIITESGICPGSANCRAGELIF